MESVLSSLKTTAEPKKDRQKLPNLREDLQLLKAANLDDGSPSWTICDTVRQKYFRIGWLEFEILSRWQEGDPDSIVNKIKNETTLKVGPEQIEALCRFLLQNNLLENNDHSHLVKQHEGQSRQKIVSRILRNYLFFKIPLWRPDDFLTATMPFFRFFFSPLFWWSILLLALSGFYLTSKQWDSFQETFLFFFSLKGVIFYAAALTVTKAFHEMGHAYAAKRFGLRIPSMGVAFLLFWPMLYTDTSDAWRLPCRKNRLLISSSGILMELVIAIGSLFIWNFLPEGPLKSAFFLLASTTWLVTLTVNINPFMRFDGYYIFSDLLDIANMQERSFLLAKWRLRKTMFGLKDECPENLPPWKKNTLIIYAYGTWLYRFFLFLGIALLIYHYTFKLLGIFLMALEITMFITMPIVREVKAWWGIRKKITLNPHLFSSCFFLLILLFISIFPWPTTISIPALYQASFQTYVYPPKSGQLKAMYVAHNDYKKEGEPLFQLYSPLLPFQVKQGKIEVDILQQQLDRIDFSEDDSETVNVLQKRLIEKLTALNGYVEQLKKLTVLAPISGRIIMLNSVKDTSWVNENDRLFMMVDDSTSHVEGFVHEKDLQDIGKGTFGRFYPASEKFSPFDIRIKDVDMLDTKVLPEEYYASTYGGDIPVQVGQDGSLIPREGYYRLSLLPVDQGPDVNRVLPGTVRMNGPAKNIFQKIWPQIITLLIRESSF